MYRTCLTVLRWASTLPILRANHQGGASRLEAYFSGKKVVLKIDMPGTQKGVDLKFNKPSPMDWKEYGSRVKQFGIAIHRHGPSDLDCREGRQDRISTRWRRFRHLWRRYDYDRCRKIG